VKTVNPYLNFDGNTEEAFNFYRSVFGGEFLQLVRFKDFGAGANAMGDLNDDDLNKVAHVGLPLGDGQVLMGTDTLQSLGQKLEIGNNSYIAIEADSPDEAARLFDGLCEGGKVEMPLEAQPWTEKYGSCTDRFGVQWMVSYTGDAQFMVGT
jgi:PhnB protein